MTDDAKFAFRPRLIPTVCTIVLVPILASLGFWQLDRAQQKTDQQNLYQSRYDAPAITIGVNRESPEELKFRQVQVTGRWDLSREFYLDNQVLDGQPGYHVITPLVLRGEQIAALVNRGWILASPDRSIAPKAKSPATMETTVAGIAVVPSRDVFVLKADPVLGAKWQTVWQTLDLTRFADAAPYRIHGIVIRMNADHSDGFARRWKPLDNVWIYRHKAYAFQWFALAATLLVIYFVFAVRRQPKSENAS